MLNTRSPFTYALLACLLLIACSCKTTQKSLSVSTNDYMLPYRPFYTSVITPEIWRYALVTDSLNNEGTEPNSSYPYEHKESEEAFLKFFRDSLDYPDIAMEYSIQGRVRARFRVTREGGMDSITILRGVDDYLDREVIKTLKNRPAGRLLSTKTASRLTCSCIFGFILNSNCKATGFCLHPQPPKGGFNAQLPLK